MIDDRPLELKNKYLYRHRESEGKKQIVELIEEIKDDGEGENSYEYYDESEGPWTACAPKARSAPSAPA